jgi:hypothetical protein
MHRCLEIQEIDRTICEYIDDKATLSALARTCRTLENPALDILWETQYSLLNVFRTFPSDLWRGGQIDTNGLQGATMASTCRLIEFTHKS